VISSKFLRVFRATFPPQKNKQKKNLLTKNNTQINASRAPWHHAIKRFRISYLMATAQAIHTVNTDSIDIEKSRRLQAGGRLWHGGTFGMANKNACSYVLISYGRVMCGTSQA
jgi:hypothetical protein